MLAPQNLSFFGSETPLTVPKRPSTKTMASQPKFSPPALQPAALHQPTQFTQALSSAQTIPLPTQVSRIQFASNTLTSYSRTQ